MNDPLPPAEAIVPAAQVRFDPSAAPEPAALAPVAPPATDYERLPALDLMRGIAILAILLANIPHFSFHTEGSNPRVSLGTPGDHVVVALTLLLVDFKFITLLSMLFGAGLALQRDRALAAQRPFAWYYVRRMLFLFLIGLVHGLLLWWGDILAPYAVVGLGALLVSYLSARGIKWFIAGCLTWFYGWLLVITVIVVVLVLTGLDEKLKPKAKDEQTSSTTTRNEHQRRGEEIGKQIQEYFSAENTTRIYREGAYWEMVLNRAIYVASGAIVWVLYIGWYILACFLIGVLLQRRGVFHDVERNRWLVRRMVWLGLGIGVPLHVAGAIAYAMNPSGPASWIFNFFGCLPQALGYLGLFLWWSRTRLLWWLQYLLQSVGRMALTNYLLQSVICGFVFYSYGFGLFGQVGRLPALLLVAGIWIAELAWSPIWLRYFHAGPVEWAWRSLAEGRLRPFLRRSQASAG